MLKVSFHSFPPEDRGLRLGGAISVCQCAFEYETNRTAIRRKKLKLSF